MIQFTDQGVVVQIAHDDRLSDIFARRMQQLDTFATGVPTIPYDWGLIEELHDKPIPEYSKENVRNKEREILGFRDMSSSDELTFPDQYLAGAPDSYDSWQYAADKLNLVRRVGLNALLVDKNRLVGGLYPSGELPTPDTLLQQVNVIGNALLTQQYVVEFLDEEGSVMESYDFNNPALRTLAGDSMRPADLEGLANSGLSRASTYDTSIPVQSISGKFGFEDMTTHDHKRFSILRSMN